MRHNNSRYPLVTFSNGEYVFCVYIALVAPRQLVVVPIGVLVFAAFGEKILGSDGDIDRKKLGEIVFGITKLYPV